MIKAGDFVQFLKEQGIEFYTGVPCSFFKDVINCLEQTSGNYTIAPNEGSALSLASGAVMGGQGAAVMIQNSGLGNLINPLTSLCMIYKIPVLLFVSGRAYGVADEPQHEIMGAKMTALLDSIGVPHCDLPSDSSWQESLKKGIETMKRNKSPFVVLVRKDTFEKFKRQPSAPSAYPMKRVEAVKIISEYFQPEDLAFATTGMISRELFALADRPGNFYMQGSMGHIGAVAMGAAMTRPDRKVFVLDGDGAFLMHMGNTSMIGHYKPANLFHIVLDNEAYETTGDQDTTAKSCDFEAVARACGYTSCASAASEADFREKLQELSKKAGPTFLRVKINRLETHDIPRISTRYSSAQITENFTKAACNLAAKANG